MKKGIFLATMCACMPVGGLLMGASPSVTLANSSADSYLSGASPNLNFGGAGLLVVAPASSPQGEFNSILKFNLAPAASQFDSIFGPRTWQITGLTLNLASNYGTNGAVPNNASLNVVRGGKFAIDWLAGDNWIEGNAAGTGAANGGVAFSSIPSLFQAGSAPLGTFAYSPPGNNVYAKYSLPLNPSLIADATAGGDVTLYFRAADDQVSYLFNSRSFATGNPQLVITAVPEPGSIAIFSLAMSAAGLRARLKPRASKN